METQEEAVVLISAISQVKQISLGYMPGYHDCYIDKINNPEKNMISREVFTKNSFIVIKDSLEKYELAKKEYKKSKELFDTVVKQRTHIIETVMEAVNDARAIKRRREEVKSAYERYLTLASGNTSIALNFLFSAYPDASTFGWVRGSLENLDSKGDAA